MLCPITGMCIRLHRHTACSSSYSIYDNINMSCTTDASSLAPVFESADLKPARLRARSSLDTFVIPGRTRLPSSKDIQSFGFEGPSPEHYLVSKPRALGFLKAVRKKMLKPRSSNIGGQNPRRSHAGESNKLEGNIPSKSDHRKQEKAAAAASGHQLISAPRRLELSQESRMPLLDPPRPGHGPDAPRLLAMDGHDSPRHGSEAAAGGSSPKSRHVMSSSSSSSGMGRRYFTDKYNRLAAQHNLPPFVPDSEGDIQLDHSNHRTH